MSGRSGERFSPMKKVSHPVHGAGCWESHLSCGLPGSECVWAVWIRHAANCAKASSTLHAAAHSQHVHTSRDKSVGGSTDSALRSALSLCAADRRACGAYTANPGLISFRSTLEGYGERGPRHNEPSSRSVGSTEPGWAPLQLEHASCDS